MIPAPSDWDFAKTDVLEEETQAEWSHEAPGDRPVTPEVRVYHRAPKASTGSCLEFDGGQRVPIGEQIRIGRNFFNEVVIFGDGFVSRRHAEVGERSGSLYVIDLGSRNGTYLNGKPLPRRKEMALALGDTILFGTSVEAKVAAIEEGPASPSK